MMKFYTILTFLFFSITIYGIETKKDAGNDIRLKIRDVVSTEKQITIKYSLHNLSDQDIWVCMSHDTEQKINEKLDVGVVKKIKKNDKTLILEVKSVPFDILTGPLGAFYKLVKKDKFEDFTIKIKFPVIDNSDLSYGLADEKEKKETVDLKNVRNIILRVGYYTKDLDSTKGCCVNPAKKYPPNTKKVYYDWARDNKEKTIEIKIKLEKK